MILFSSPAMTTLRKESTSVGRPVCPEFFFNRCRFDLSLETLLRM